MNGELIVQDKLFLTPWETQFAGGKALQLIEFAGLRIAVIICLDIEIPNSACCCAVKAWTSSWCPARQRRSWAASA